VDGDGDDDLVVFDSGKLRAIHLGKGDGDATRVLWEETLPSGYNPRVIDFFAPAAGNPSTIVVQFGATVYGFAGTTGKPVWINVGPQPVTAAGTPQWVTAQLLKSSTQNGPPAAVFQGADQIAVCRAPRMAVDKPSLSDPQPTAGALTPVTLATTTAASNDPRMLRRLPWAVDWGVRWRDAKITAWGMFTGTLFFLLPGWTLYRMLVRRQWSMRTMLLLPALAGLMLVVIQFPVPEGVESYGGFSLWDRIGLAFACTPPLVLLCLLVHHFRRRHWRGFLHLGIVILGFTAVVIFVGFLTDLQRLGPGERYTVSD